MFPAFGFNSWAQNYLTLCGAYSNFYSQFNNGSRRVGFRVNGYSPTPQVSTQYQAKEFPNYSFIPVMQHLGNNGVISPPGAFQYIWPDSQPSMSYMTNWGGPGATGPTLFNASPTSNDFIPFAPIR